MSRLSLATVKTKFQTGDRPTQTDYEDLIDSTSAQATDLGSYGNNENTTNEQLGMFIRQMYRAKVDEADETIKRLTEKINEYEK